MSEEQMEQQEHSAEDKFFGVKTVIGKKPDESNHDSDIDIEVIDDRPPEDRRPPAKETKEVKAEEGPGADRGVTHLCECASNAVKHRPVDPEGAVCFMPACHI